SGADGGAGSGGGDLRDYERRRHDGAGAGPDQILRSAWVEDDDGGGFDPVPVTERALHSSRRGVTAAYVAWRVSHDCVRERSGWRRIACCAGVWRCFG